MNSIKFLSFFCLAIIFSSELCAQKEIYKTKTERKAFLRELGAFCSSDIQCILKSDSIYEFEQWLDGNKKEDLLNDYSTIIHELFHGLSFDTLNGQKFFLDSNFVVFVPFTEIFSSQKLNDLIPKKSRDSIYRFGIYVEGINKLPNGQVVKELAKGRGEVGSVVKGIYGLFEEFCAYYYGAKTNFQLYNYYKKENGLKNDPVWTDYIEETKGDMVAFYEFQIFMSNYLKNAKNKYPEIYKGILNNEVFKAAFTLFYNRFETLVQEFEQIEKSIYEFQTPHVFELLDLEFSNKELYNFIKLDEDKNPDDFFEIKNGEYLFKLEPSTFQDLKKYYNIFVKQIKDKVKPKLLLFFTMKRKYTEYLKNVLKNTVHELEVLKIKDLNELNYKNYFKITY